MHKRGCPFGRPRLPGKNIFDFIRDEDVETLRKYVDGAGPVHVADALGETSLFLAASTGNVEMMKVRKTWSLRRFKSYRRDDLHFRSRVSHGTPPTIENWPLGNFFLESSDPPSPKSTPGNSPLAHEDVFPLVWVTRQEQKAVVAVLIVPGRLGLGYPLLPG